MPPAVAVNVAVAVAGDAVAIAVAVAAAPILHRLLVWRFTFKTIIILAINFDLSSDLIFLLHSQSPLVVSTNQPTKQPWN